jgi:arylsulfatase A-like enzyme
MRASRAAALGPALVDAAAILAVWGAALFAEDVALGFLWRDQFSGPWEISQARHIVGPIALVMLAPLALAASAGWRLALRAAGGSRAAIAGFTAAGAAAAFALALGVTQGRHFASWGARGPFVLALALAGAGAGRWGVASLANGARRPVALGLFGLVVALAGWTADAYVLPRLYPAFHAATLIACLFGAALAALAGRTGAPEPGRGTLALAGAAGLALVICVAITPRASRSLERATNLRIVLVEHAPLMGQAVSFAMALRPPAPLDAAAVAVAPGEVARSLDWGGHDLVLISVDALRADHVSAYGYGRPTTPNLDALAAEGTRFEHAYCPTPHTSYSLSSMMTGKYLRPLLALGLGEDSETWAQHLRRYGWRTGAFYPPAVFFIDEDRFTRFEDERLGFEYAKVEFADPALRERQVSEFVDAAPPDRPLFLWVHFFEPHEPYVVHPEHVFEGGSSPDMNAYDSEVATADDGIGRITRLVRARRPGAIVMVTADHGEEFGEHGGRYHGTTVYDEQVRVPLVVVGPGVRARQVVQTVVQTIDLLPTALSALGIPRPARLRGRDLGPLLAGEPKAADDGRAFVETDDYELMASGPDRLICQRRAAACALYRPADDPLERRDRSGDDPARFEAMRALLRDVALDHGRYETVSASAWPEPLRRGLQGEVEAAPDVAALLEDAEVSIRRKAAEVCFGLHAPATAPEVAHALAHDEDDEVRRWAALALARMGEPLPPLAEALLHDPGRDWRRDAALALGERGDARGCDEMAAWWGEAAAGLQPSPNGEPPRLPIDLAHARELLAAIARARCRSAVPALVRSLEDVRARPYVADTLGALGDDRARTPLLAALGSEPYVTTRPREARALLALGVHDWSASEPAGDVHTSITVPPGGSRLVVLLSDPHAELAASADGAPEPAPSASGVASDVAAAGSEAGGEVRVVELESRPESRRLRLDLHASTGGVVAVWAVPAARPAVAPLAIPASSHGRLD